MCLSVYLSSTIELPEIPWNEQDPGFYISRLQNQKVLAFLSEIVDGPFVYEPLSFMGCSCGLSYDESTKDDPSDNYSQRLKDVADFMAYLSKHSRQSELQLFCTMWDEFPDSYPRKSFSPTNVNRDEFDLEELVVLEVR